MRDELYSCKENAGNVLNCLLLKLEKSLSLLLCDNLLHILAGDKYKYRGKPPDNQIFLSLKCNLYFACTANQNYCVLFLLHGNTAFQKLTENSTKIDGPSVQKYEKLCN